MAISEPEVALPPPPEQAEPGPESEARLSWWTVLFAALAAVPAGLLFNLFWWGQDPLHGSGWSIAAVAEQLADARVRWQLLHSFGGWLWHGGKLGLGLVLVDRLAPRTWGRPLRWTLGAGMAGLVFTLSTWQEVFRGQVTLDTLASAAPFKAVAVVGNFFCGFYLAWMLRPGKSPWKRLPFAALEAWLIVGVVGAVVNYVYWRCDQSFSRDVNLAHLWFMNAVLLVRGGIGAVLTGLALAAGLTLGRPLRLEFGPRLREAVERIFS